MGKINRTLPKYTLQLKNAPGSSAGTGAELTDVQVGLTEQATKEAELKAAEVAKNKDYAGKRKEKEKKKEKDTAKSTNNPPPSSQTGGIPESSSKLSTKAQDPGVDALVPASAPEVAQTKKRYAGNDMKVGGNNEASKRHKVSTVPASRSPFLLSVCQEG